MLKKVFAILWALSFINIFSSQSNDSRMVSDGRKYVDEGTKVESKNKISWYEKADLNIFLKFCLKIWARIQYWFSDCDDYNKFVKTKNYKSIAQDLNKNRSKRCKPKHAAIYSDCDDSNNDISKKTSNTIMHNNQVQHFVLPAEPGDNNNNNFTSAIYSDCDDSNNDTLNNNKRNNNNENFAGNQNSGPTMDFNFNQSFVPPLPPPPPVIMPNNNQHFKQSVQAPAPTETPEEKKILEIFRDILNPGRRSDPDKYLSDLLERATKLCEQHNKNISDDIIRKVIEYYAKFQEWSNVKRTYTEQDTARLLKITEGRGQIHKDMQRKNVQLSNNLEKFFDFIRSSDNDQDKNFGLELIYNCLDESDREKRLQLHQKIAHFFAEDKNGYLLSIEKAYKVAYKVVDYYSLGNNPKELTEIYLNLMKHMSEGQKYKFLTYKDENFTPYLSRELLNVYLNLLVDLNKININNFDKLLNNFIYYRVSLEDSEIKFISLYKTFFYNLLDFRSDVNNEVLLQNLHCVLQGWYDSLIEIQKQHIKEHIKLQQTRLIEEFKNYIKFIANKK